MSKAYNADEQYADLVGFILERGVRKPNRTGVDTIGVFSYQMRFDLRDGTIPMLTTKKMHTKSIIHEILWYLQGDENIKYLKDNGVTIWDEWTDKNGNLGPVYGVQWRNWQKFRYVPGHAEGSEWIEDEYRVEHIDQIATLVDKLKNNPLDRRLIVSAWNVADLPDMKLPPCHYSFQCYTRPLSYVERACVGFGFWFPPTWLVTASPTEQQTKDLDDMNVPKYALSLMINQRSCDVGLGVPFNIVQYAILTRMLAEVANMVPEEMIWNGGDVHIYENHVDALKEQITRKPFDSPTFRFARKIDNIDDFKYDDFIIGGYQSHPAIKMEVAV